jgi:radical SAM protein with 4Fe4S-binding SPASM domain
MQKYLPLSIQNVLRRIRIKTSIPLYRQLPLDIPLSMHIDPSNLCNFQCVFCPTGDKKLLSTVNRFNGMMSLELFKKIIDDSAFMVNKTGKRLRQLHLYKDGEPLLNPHFIAMAAYAKKKNVARNIGVTTNGSLLTEELSSELLRCGINTIRISVEHSDGEGYKKITKNYSDFDGLRAKIAFLYNEKKRSASTVRIIVKTNDAKLSIPDKNRFLSIFRPLCDEIKIDSLMGWSSSDKKDFMVGCAVKTAMDGITPLLKKTICPEPFSKCAVNPDGTVSVCCVDWAYATIVGDLKKQSLLEVWHGKAFHDFRMTHVRGKRDSLPACASCQYILGFPLSENLDAHAEKLAAFYSNNEFPYKNR